ncbi:MAG: hypothetical protein ACOCVF_03455 [bacterium]
MIKIILVFFILVLPFENINDEKTLHFESIERKSNRIVKEIYSLTPTIYWMIENGWKSHVTKYYQYDISKPYKTKIGTVRYVSAWDVSHREYDPYIRKYEMVKYPNRLYCFNIINVNYEISQVHIMESTIVAVYYSSKYKNLYYKVTYDHDFHIIHTELIQK